MDYNELSSTIALSDSWLPSVILAMTWTTLFLRNETEGRDGFETTDVSSADT